MNRIIATFIASLTLTAACAEAPLDEQNDDVVFVAVEADEEVELEPSVIDYGETDLRSAEQDYGLGEPWIRDCNICVRTKTGATCTLMACDDIDDRDGSTTCENDAFAMGDTWAVDDCNVCTCTAAGSVCTIQECGLGFDFTDAPKQDSCGARSCNSVR
jgi:hypothetical protein